MLRTVSPNLTHEVDVDGTVLIFRGITVREKYKLLAEISKPSDTVDTDKLFDGFRDILSSVIIGVKDGMPFNEFFDKLEYMEDVKAIIKAIITYCGLSEDERKNSDSSSGQPTPASAGNAEKPAVPDGEPVLITQRVTEQLPEEDRECYQSSCVEDRNGQK